MYYFIITYGCQMNKSDSERIATILEKKGYLPAKDENQANLIVLNMCSVRQSAVDRAYNKIRGFDPALRGRTPLSKKIILTGCILEQDKKKLIQYGKVMKFTDLFKIEPKLKYQEGFTLLNSRKANLTGLIPIMEGCNNFCTYCVVPYTRGKEYYREKEEIIKEVKRLIKKGFKKITLLGQNVNSYPDFPQLLEEITNLLGDFELTFLTSHPKNFSDKLIDVMAKNKKIVKYLNLPVQSGDNEILKKMNRPYTVEQYKNLVKKIRKKIPDIKLSTDIIVGFPGETEKQFQNTVKLFKEIKFNNAYISKYSPRPGTAAFKLKDNVSLEEKKRREKILRSAVTKSDPATVKKGCLKINSLLKK